MGNICWMKKLLLLLILLPSLVSCIVLHEEYFHPEANGASVEKESCRGKVGADNKLVYKLGGSSLIFSISNRSSPIELVISLKVYEDSFVIWPDQTIDIYVDDNKIQLKADSFTRLRYVDRYASGDIERKEYPVNSIMNRTDHENSQRISFRGYYDSYVSSLTLQEKPVNEIRIDKVKVIVSGQEHILKNMTFKKEDGLFLHPLNC